MIHHNHHPPPCSLSHGIPVITMSSNYSTFPWCGMQPCSTVCSIGISTPMLGHSSLYLTMIPHMANTLYPTLYPGHQLLLSVTFIANPYQLSRQLHRMQTSKLLPMIGLFVSALYLCSWFIWISMKACTDIRGPQEISTNESYDSYTFPLSSKMLACYYWMACQKIVSTHSCS